MRLKHFSFVMLLLGINSCSNKSNVKEDIQTQTDLNIKESSSEMGNLAAEKLISQNNCNSCHHLTNTLVGPSYQRIAQKYNAKDMEIMVKSIREGSKGKWGEIPMMPNSQVTKEDAKEIAFYILSVK